jgi:hypothetical protein
MRKLFGNDEEKFQRIEESAIKYLKYEATSLRYLCEGLEIFEGLNVVKHENRKDLLIKIKNLIQND